MVGMVGLSGCATFSGLMPTGAYTDISKGVWVAKTSTFLGVRFASQQVLFCYADNKMKPICTRAGGDVEAASLKQSVAKTQETQQ
jgi:hypothetical protein